MPNSQRKAHLLMLLLPAFAALCGGCRSVDYTANLTGLSNDVALLSKSFVVVGGVSVYTSEIHRAGPFGIVKSIEGSKITYGDLVRTAIVLNADDIIDVRIDVNTVAKTSFADWLTGWERTYTYTGSALAIVYVDMPFQEGSAADKDETEIQLDFFRR